MCPKGDGRDAIVVTRLDDVHGDLRATYTPTFPAHKPVFGTRRSRSVRWPGIRVPMEMKTLARSP